MNGSALGDQKDSVGPCRRISGGVGGICFLKRSGCRLCENSGGGDGSRGWLGQHVEIGLLRVGVHDGENVENRGWVRLCANERVW